MHPSKQPTARRRWRCSLLLIVICSASLCLQAADLPRQPNAATNRYEFHQPHDRAGIGKFYMGREIAQVMGHEAADWLERPERDTEEHTEVLVEQLKLKPGD